MTQNEKVATVKALANDEELTEDLISVYLKKAESAIFNRMFPFEKMLDFSVPAKYEMIQCELACRYVTRRGAEGEVTHKENGIDRTYGSVNDSDLLSEVMQVI